MRPHTMSNGVSYRERNRRSATDVERLMAKEKKFILGSIDQEQNAGWSIIWLAVAGCLNTAWEG